MNVIQYDKNIKTGQKTSVMLLTLIRIKCMKEHTGNATYIDWKRKVKKLTIIVYLDKQTITYRNVIPIYVDLKIEYLINRLTEQKKSFTIEIPELNETITRTIGEIYQQFATIPQREYERGLPAMWKERVLYFLR